MENEIKFDGYCPFLGCIETGPHSHKVCQACGTVNYSNFYCSDCRKELAKIYPKSIEEIEKALREAGDIE